MMIDVSIATDHSKWLICDVIVTSWHVIIDISQTESVKLMAKQETLAKQGGDLAIISANTFETLK